MGPESNLSEQNNLFADPVPNFNARLQGAAYAAILYHYPTNSSKTASIGNEKQKNLSKKTGFASKSGDVSRNKENGSKFSISFLLTDICWRQ